MRRHEHILAGICLIDPRDPRSALPLFDGRERDWARLFNRAKREGILNLLFHHLRQTGMLEAVPAEMRWDAQNCYYVSSLKNARLNDETARVLAAFRSHGIRHIILKGAFIAQHFYGDPALRPSSDIDMLIDQRDLVQADAFLRQQGYAPPANFSDFAFIQRRTPLNSLMYHRFEDGICLDLHWHIVNSTWPLYSWITHVDRDSIWQEAEEVCVGGVRTRALCPHHQIIFLSCHAMQHCFDTLLLLTDIVQAIRFYGKRLEWGKVISSAEQWHMLTVVRAALHAVSQRLQFPLRDLDRRLLVGRVTGAGIAGLLAAPASRYVLAYLLGLCSEDSPAGRLRYLTETVIPSAYVIAHNNDIPVNRVRYTDYLLRFAGSMRSVFSAH